MRIAYPTVETVRSLFDYCPLTGRLTWKAKLRNGRSFAGRVAGYSSGKGEKDYRRVMIAEQAFMLHRICWIHYYGVVPKQDLDHIDCDKTHNAIFNLREVSKTINSQNQRKAKSNNQLGVLGVSRNGSKFKAVICVNKATMYLGTFNTVEEASSAYLDAKRAYHDGCTI